METEEYVREWLRKERQYTIQKFGLDADDEHTNIYVGDWWEQQLNNYLYRARVLGIDSINGRQALAKFVATGVGMLEACVRKYGPLPIPGVTSGDNLGTIFIP